MVSKFENTIQSNIVKYRNAIKYVTTAVIVILLMIAVLMLYAPFSNLQKFNKVYSDSTLISFDKEELLNDEKFFELKKHEAYLKSKLLVAKNDSISLSINLPDSTISIEVQGVLLHQSKLTSISNSMFFERASHLALFNYFQSPFKTNKSISNIEKEPVIYMKAPKDTVEAAKNQLIADTSLAKRVYVRIELERGLTIILTDNQSKWSRSYIYNTFSSGLLRFGLSLRDIFHFKVPSYNPVIRIKLDRNSLISIYRAIPDKAYVTIHM